MSDLIVAGGVVRAGYRAGDRDAEALLVTDGRVALVGSEADVRGAAGPGARTIDVDGGIVAPGFIDAHVHPLGAALTLATCGLEDAGSAETALKLVGDYAGEHPDRDWVSGGGWSMEWFPGGVPSASALDTVVPDRPAFLINADGHGAWVNSAALRLAGVDASTPDPANGRIERLPDGSPQGTLHESAMDLVSTLMPVPSLPEQVDALGVAQDHLFTHGVTGWQDAIVGSYATFPDALEAYRTSERDGLLRARVVGALWWDRGRGLEQIEDLVARRELASGSTRFRATTVKMMLDGVAENHTAAMLSPYLDPCGCQSANTGLSYVDPEVQLEAVRRLDALGFQVHFHALGDRAVRQALDAVEATRAANGPGGRHHLAHLQVVHPDDVPRFGALDATANLQALWACHAPQMDELTIPFLDPDAVQHQYPFASLVAAGTRLCAGSDWPVSSPDPLAAVYVAATRQNPDLASEPFLPEQAIPAAALLDAYTAGSAWVNGLEHETGRLDPGLAADFVVLDGDPLDPGDRRICDLTVQATYIDGEQVYAS